MPFDTGFDAGLLSPVTVGHDGLVTDAEVLGALVAAEVALVRAAGDLGLTDAAAEVSARLGWVGAGVPCIDHGVDLAALAAASVSGGNPVIPLVPALAARVGADLAPQVHRGPTSQDILDSALMLVARRAITQTDAALVVAEEALVDFARVHRDQVAAARTLTQHAVPTTMGLRAANWLRGVRRARARLAQVVLPAQLGGAGGTLASFVELYGPESAAALPAAFAAQLGLDVPDAPWHTTRWPITELGDALVAVIDAFGVIASDVATLSRTEIGELSEGTTGGSSAMPHKQNPAVSVMLRSAALRAPQLAATLHLAAAFAVDERPDGAWHAEWPALRELLRLVLGVSANGAALLRGLRVDADAVARNVALTDGAIVSEKVKISGADADRNPSDYLGLAAHLVDDAVQPHPQENPV